MQNPVTATDWLKEIPLKAVDLTDDYPLAVAPPPALAPLMASIQEVGLLAPPWLRPTSEGRWQVVAGLKRLLAVAQLGWETVLARVLPADTPASYCLLVALYDNAFTRGFNLLEQAVFAARLCSHWDRQTVVAKFLPYLGLPPSPVHLDRLLALATLKPPFQELARDGRLALTAAASLAGWPPQERAAVLPFLKGLVLSQSMQEEFLENLALLARREGSTASAILARPELQQVLADPARTPKERSEAVRRQVQRWVSPRFSAAREAFQAALGRLGLRNHPRLRLTPPPAFEGPDFHLEIRFGDAPELQKLLEEMSHLVQREEFSEMIRL